MWSILTKFKFKSLHHGLVWVIFSLLVVAQSGFTQGDECPTAPEGLSNIVNMEWVDVGEVMRLGIGGNYDNLYQNIWLEWDISTGELDAVPFPGTVEALGLINRLELNLEYFYPPYGFNQTYLSLSPSLLYAIYFDDADVYGVEGDGEPQLLGTLSFATLEAMIWLSDNDLIIVGEPPYGTMGFDNIIAHVCVDGSCFTNFSRNSQDSLGRPGIDILRRKMVVYGIYDGTIFIYDLENDSLTRQFTIDVALQPIFRPMWSEDGTSLYVMSYGTGINLELYRITLETREIRLVAEVNRELTSRSWDNWLLSESRQFFVVSTSDGIFVQCF